MSTSNESRVLYIYQLAPMDEWSHTVPPVSWIESYADSVDTTGYYQEQRTPIPDKFRLSYVPRVFEWLNSLEEWSMLHYPPFLSPIKFLQYRFHQLYQATRITPQSIPWEGDGLIGINGFPSVDIYTIVPTIFIKQHNNGTTFFLTPYAVPILEYDAGSAPPTQIPVGVIYPSSFDAYDDIWEQYRQEHARDDKHDDSPSDF
jgi:hypothetical protein